MAFSNMFKAFEKDALSACDKISSSVFVLVILSKNMEPGDLVRAFKKMIDVSGCASATDFIRLRQSFAASCRYFWELLQFSMRLRMKFGLSVDLMAFSGTARIVFVNT